MSRAPVTAGPTGARAERSAARPVSRPHDAQERQADRAADIVAAGGAVSGWSFSAVPVSAGSPAPVQRQEIGGGPPKTEDEKKKAAAAAAAEAFLETEYGKPIKEKATDVLTSPAGLAGIAGGVVGLGLAGRELPVQPSFPIGPEGLSAGVTWKGPVFQPSTVGLSLTYREPAPKRRGSKQTERERYRAETARLAAEQDAFRRSLRQQGEQEAEEQLSRQALDKVLSPRKREDDQPLLQRSPAPGASGHTHAHGEPGHHDPAGGRSGRPVEAALRTGVRPLDGPVRGFMEARFGHDFSRVRVHDDAGAAAAARSVQASAFTVGTDVVFGGGGYRPDTPRGRWLLAHELAHVAQSDRGDTASATHAVEHDASQAATAALRGRPVRLRTRRRPGELHCFGEPDHVPDLTFVSTSGEQGFLNQAVAFHRTWGLAPRRFDSMHHLLTQLAASTGSISRLRIVSHANHDNIFTPLFAGGSAGITEADLLAFGESDVAGLRHVLGAPMVATAAFRAQVLDAVRGSNAEPLVPFGLDQAGAVPAGAVARLVDTAIELRAVRTATGTIPAAQRATLERALTAEVAGLRAEVQQQPPAGAGVTAAQAGDLEQAVAAAPGFTFTLDQQPADFVAAVGAATTGLGQGFRATLDAVRARLGTDSWVDVRGCRVGQQQSYLAAVGRFFGTAGAQPHVSGPDLFQSYPRLGFRTVAEADIAGLAADTDVRAALDHWGGVTGVRTRMLWWLTFLTNVLIQDVLSSQPPSGLPVPPGLSGGLQLPLDPLVAPLTLPPLEAPALAPRLGGARGLGLAAGPRLTNPLVAIAQRELALYGGAAGELRYYLDAGLPLPVQQAANVENITLFLKAGSGRAALDAWLNSQWEPAAPGLPALLRGNWQRDELRQVEAVSELDDQRRPVAMFVSPDPRYAEHIRTT